MSARLLVAHDFCVIDTSPPPTKLSVFVVLLDLTALDKSKDSPRLGKGSQSVQPSAKL